MNNDQLLIDGWRQIAVQRDDLPTRVTVTRADLGELLCACDREVQRWEFIALDLQDRVETLEAQR